MAADNGYENTINKYETHCCSVIDILWVLIHVFHGLSHLSQLRSHLRLRQGLSSASRWVRLRATGKKELNETKTKTHQIFSSHQTEWLASNSPLWLHSRIIAGDFNWPCPRPRKAETQRVCKSLTQAGIRTHRSTVAANYEQEVAVKANNPVQTYLEILLLYYS